MLNREIPSTALTAAQPMMSNIPRAAILGKQSNLLNFKTYTGHQKAELFLKNCQLNNLQTFDFLLFSLLHIFIVICLLINCQQQFYLFYLFIIKSNQNQAISFDSSAKESYNAFCWTLLLLIACFNLKLCLSRSSNSSNSLLLRASRWS